MKRKILRLLVTLTLALSLCPLMASPAYAAHTLTPGASVDIDADTNGGAYTALNNISFTDAPELAATNTFYLTAPAGFEFDTGAAADQAIGTGYAGGVIIDLGAGAGVAQAPTYTGTTVATWTVNAAGTVGAGTITISGMTIRPAVGTTTITGDGTANVTIAGNATTFDNPNAHPIDHVPGAHAAYTVVTENAGTEVAGVGFSITLEAVDQHGNVNNDGANIVAGAIAITWTSTATNAPDGTPPTPIADGAQTFTAGAVTTGTDWTLTNPGETPTITATSPGPLTGTSAAITVNPGAATQLVFTIQPAGSVSGDPLTTQPVVLAQDQFGTTDTTYVANVVAATDDLGTLTGITTKAAVAGVATFTDLTYTASADGETFQIDVTSGALTGATSNDVTSTITIGPTGGGAPPPAPAPPAPAAVAEVGSVDTTPYVDPDTGISDRDIGLSDATGLAAMSIPAGTQVTLRGNPYTGPIQIIPLSTPPPPAGYTLVGPAYDCLPDGLTFEPAITLTFTYDTADIPDGVSEEDLVLAYWVDDTWAMLATTVDTVANTVTANVAHFTPFAILAELPEAPTAFVTSDLSITPAEVETNEAVTISVSVANTSGMEGSYTVVLMINGVAEAEESVTIAAGDSQSASFSVTKEDTGSYSIAIDDLSGTFVVTGATPPPASPTAVNWGLIGGIIAGVIIVGIITWRVVSSRRS